MKRFVSLLLGLLMVFVACTAFADAVATVKPGDELELKISIESASGKAAKIGIRTNGAPVTFVRAAGENHNDTVPPRAFDGFFVVVNDEGIAISADGTRYSGTPVGPAELKNGTIGTLTIKVNEDAAPGTYTVEAYKKSGSVTVVGSMTFIVEGNSAGERVPGDANKDGRVDTGDALAIMQWIAGFPGVTIDETNGNCNGDGEVNTGDALAIMQWIAGFPGVELK